MVTRTMGATEWALVGLLALVWGGTFYFVEIMLEAMVPVSAVLLRVAPAAAALTILVYATGLRLPGDLPAGGRCSSWACSTTSSPSA